MTPGAMQTKGNRLGARLLPAVSSLEGDNAAKDIFDFLFAASGSS